MQIFVYQSILKLKKIWLNQKISSNQHIISIQVASLIRKNWTMLDLVIIIAILNLEKLSWQWPTSMVNKPHIYLIALMEKSNTWSNDLIWSVIFPHFLLHILNFKLFFLSLLKCFYCCNWHMCLNHCNQIIYGLLFCFTMA